MMSGAEPRVGGTGEKPPVVGGRYKTDIFGAEVRYEDPEHLRGIEGAVKEITERHPNKKVLVVVIGRGRAIAYVWWMGMITYVVENGRIEEADWP